MVEISSSFFVGFAIIFVVLLAIIVYGSRGTPTAVKSKEKKKNPKKEKVVTEKKVPAKKRTASKKAERVNETPKRYVVDTNTDTREVLEFLKGKDKKEIAKQLAQDENRAAKQKGQQQSGASEELQPTRSISEKEAAAFQPVKVKPKKEKTEEENAENAENTEATEGAEKKGKRGPKPFLKAEKEAKEKKKQEWAERKKLREEGGVVEGEDGEKKERRERRPRRQEGEEGQTGDNEQRERKPRRQRQAEDGNGEEGEQRERKPRGPKIPTFEEVDRTVKYEAADIGDILSSIGASYKPTVATRYPSVFSKIQRGVMIRKILTYLSASDLCHLAGVNNFFSAIVRSNDELWRHLYVRDFGKNTKPPGQKNWRQAYRAAFRSKRSEARRANQPQKAKGDKAEVTEQASE